MRTIEEVNRDIKKCKEYIHTSTNNEQYFKYTALLYELQDEKELIWNTLFELIDNQKGIVDNFDVPSSDGNIMIKE